MVDRVTAAFCTRHGCNRILSTDSPCPLTRYCTCPTLITPRPYTCASLRARSFLLRLPCETEMSSPTDAVVDRIFSRELPPLEPGKSVWAPELTKTIADLNEHRFTKAGEFTIHFRAKNPWASHCWHYALTIS